MTSGLNDVERVSVKCGSSGSIHIDLHNIAKVSSSGGNPLLIFLPPYSTSSSEKVFQPPAFCSRYATAVINYRWAGFSPFEPESEPQPESECDSEQSGPNAEEDDYPPPLLNWPIPVHDTLQAYSWLIEQFTPATPTRRDVYVYGSYLGASLATSLALTESHPHHRMGVRGFVAYNGIYNWTTFLPDHHVNKQKQIKAKNFLEEILGEPNEPTEPTFDEFKQHLQGLFGSPVNLFDPFASPCLFFQTPGIWVPDDFKSPADPVKSFLEASGSFEEDAAEGELSDTSNTNANVVSKLVTVMNANPPRRSSLAFPPRTSTLRIPESLLLHTPPRPPWVRLGKRGQRRKKAFTSNHFRSQAENLAGVIRRSLEKYELKDRMKWDQDLDTYYEEMTRRVQIYDVGKDDFSYNLPVRGEEMVSDWLENRMGH